MKFRRAVIQVISDYSEFRGRSVRAEFWWWMLFAAGLLLLALAADAMVSAPLLGFPMFSHSAGYPISVFVTLILVTPTLAVAARRLHDVGHSGWWLLIGLVPLIGNLALIWLLAQQSTPEANRYGSSLMGLNLS